MLHIASAVSSQKHFEFARSLINDKGGISEFFLYNPPNSIPLAGDIDTESDKKWNEELQEGAVNVPAMDEFTLILYDVLERSTSKEENVLSLAFEVLLDPGIHGSWAQRIDRTLAFDITSVSRQGSIHIQFESRETAWWGSLISLLAISPNWTLQKPDNDRYSKRLAYTIALKAAEIKN